LKTHVEARRLHVEQIDPGQLSPGEFADRMRQSVRQGIDLVVIDSLNGYLSSMPEERHLYLHLHEMLTFLNQSGVATIVVLAQHGVLGSMRSPVDVSYLADAAILLRYFESDGRLHEAISMVKKRSVRHEKTLLDFEVGGPAGLRVGSPLDNLHGILTGVPTSFGGRGATEPTP
jgi:circadian clock protein KaiC